MRMRFIINGWNESPSYFFSLCNFTWDEIKSMAEDGKVIERNGKQFRIELE